ncbi:uncharacterized protein [Haliotis asinina]|uniref:uncharacterized protein n=1 Tax=Haliotis asinina TaxID=109174 RepID=UPI0035325EF0
MTGTGHLVTWVTYRPYVDLASLLCVVTEVNYLLTLRIQRGQETQTCAVNVLFRVSPNEKELIQHICTSRTKRDIPIGAPKSVDVSSTDVQIMASFAVTSLNGLQGTQNSLDQVISAKTQVVSGMNYMLTLRLREGYRSQLCEVTVWYQSWTNTKQVTDHHCSPVSKRSAPLLGGVEPAHLSAPIQQAVAFAEDALNGKMNSMFRMVTEKVDHVTHQVVAGMKYSFDLHLVTSSCMNNPDGNGKGISDCPASNSMPQHMTCRVSVLYQIWSHPKFQLLSNTCGQLV